MGNIKTNMKKLIIFNILAISLLIAINLVFTHLSSGKNCISLSDNGCIKGLGKVDFFNRKQGHWVFRNPDNGNISTIANLHNDKKQGELFKFYNNPYNKISNYYLFDNDSLDGVQKYFSPDGTERSAEYYKKGEWYYSKRHPRGMCIDFIDNESRDEFYHELMILEALYKEEFDNPYDDEWNHKELGSRKQLSYCYVLDDMRYEHALYWDISEQEFIPKFDNPIYINHWTNTITIINYLLLLIVLIINIIGYKKIKNDK